MAKFTKGTPKPENSGRKKGSVNKVTACSRAAMMEAFDKLGGVDALYGWAKENTTDFYKLWGKTIPTDTKITGGGEKGEIVTKIVVEHVRSDA